MLTLTGVVGPTGKYLVTGAPVSLRLTPILKPERAPQDRF